MVDMEDRLFQRIDRFEERLDDTCNRIEKIDAFITIKEEQAEKLRLERLQNNDTRAFNMYDKVQQRMIG